MGGEDEAGRTRQGPPPEEREPLALASRAKMDAKLAAALAEAGDGPYRVLVDFHGPPPPQDELTPLGLAAAGGVVIGEVTREQLAAVLARPDVRAASAFGESRLR